MSHQWTDDLPIYRQLMNEIVGWILSGKLQDGDPLPSIRKIASQFEINPLTASKAYQELANNKIVGKQRGVGLFIRAGSQKRLMRSAKEKFLQEEWPSIVKRMEQMEIDPTSLLDQLKKR